MILIQLFTTNDLTEEPPTWEHEPVCEEPQYATQLQSSGTFSHQVISITRMYDMWLLKFKVFCSDLRKVIYFVPDTGNQRIYISYKHGVVKVSKVFFV
jgi:hypothetical protein